MEYSIRLLIRERDLIQRTLKKWEAEKYPEARKIRDKRLKELNKAILILNNEKN